MHCRYHQQNETYKTAFIIQYGVIKKSGQSLLFNLRFESLKTSFSGRHLYFCNLVSQKRSVCLPPATVKSTAISLKLSSSSSPTQSSEVSVSAFEEETKFEPLLSWTIPCWKKFLRATESLKLLVNQIKTWTSAARINIHILPINTLANWWSKISIVYDKTMNEVRWECRINVRIK